MFAVKPRTEIAVLSPYEINKGWTIYYSNKDSPNMFEINIDE